MIECRKRCPSLDPRLISLHGTTLHTTLHHTALRQAAPDLTILHHIAPKHIISLHRTALQFTRCTTLTWINYHRLRAPYVVSLAY